MLHTSSPLKRLALGSDRGNPFQDRPGVALGMNKPCQDGFCSHEGVPEGGAEWDAPNAALGARIAFGRGLNGRKRFRRDRGF